MRTPSYFASYSDTHLRVIYSRLGLDRVKTGKNKGQVRMSDLKLERELVAEATRRGAEYPYNWLAGAV